MRAFRVVMGPLWFSFNSHPLPAWLLECAFFLLICKNYFYSKNQPAGQGGGFGGPCCFSGVPTHQALQPPCRPTAGLGRKGRRGPIGSPGSPAGPAPPEQGCHLQPLSHQSLARKWLLPSGRHPQHIWNQGLKGEEEQLPGKAGRPPRAAARPWAKAQRREGICP